MTYVSEKLALLAELRRRPENSLPMVDHAWKVFPETDAGDESCDDPEQNIGWDAGMLPGGRPWFLECWATSGITLLTYFLSTEGIEDADCRGLVRMLEDEGLFHRKDPESTSARLMRITDGSGREFFSLNLVLGDENGTYIEGASVCPYAELNSFNSGHSGKAGPAAGKQA